MSSASFQPAAVSADCRRRRFMRAAGAVPWITLAVLLLNAVAESAPTLWQIDRAASSEVWRWLTGHLVHWDGSHRFWDVSVFVLFAAVLERLGRGRLLMLLGVSAVACSAAFWFWCPGLATYRGLSGIDTALVGCFGAELVRRGDCRGVRWSGACLLLAITVKIAFELFHGGALFANGAAGDFVNLPLLHAVGAACGMACSWANKGAPRRARHSTVGIR